MAYATLAKLNPLRLLKRKKFRPEDSPTFCTLLWLHSHFSPDGSVRPCCIAPDAIVDENGAAYNVQTTPLPTIWNSAAANRLRAMALNGERIPTCSACYDHEPYGKSHRQHYNELWLDRKDIDISAAIAKAGDKPAFEKPLSVDYRFGNLCNLKCQICNAGNSSQIERDEVIPAWNPSSYVRHQHRGGGDEWFESEVIRAEINDFTSEVRQITLGGGEPSINKTTLAWLGQMAESGQSKRVRIHVSSNFTNISPKFFDLLAEFEVVFLNLSIDGFGSLNDYLRYPSKWSIIERNADYLDRLRSGKNIHVNIAPVINIYNALTITDLFRWARGRSWGIIANEVRGVPQIDCSIIPPRALAKAVGRMREFIRTNDLPPIEIDTISAVCQVLEKPIDADNAAHQIRRFAEFTALLDRQRKMSFRSACAEMADDIISYYGVDLT